MDWGGTLAAPASPASDLDIIELGPTMPPVILDTDFLPLEELAKRLGIPMKRALELQRMAEDISGVTAKKAKVASSAKNTKPLRRRPQRKQAPAARG